uniref:Intimal thickness related receptor IRP domain-containing protein n=1 Tax=Globisporangium ultimum (strain ATCC 200006 / CBS 805.95 / DAOM BR144) TaxID=431595 RepID=K3WR36_GLOUD
MKQEWTFDREDRTDFLIERFGFGDHGAMSVHVRDVQYTLQREGDKEAQTQDVRAGLLFIHENALWETVQFMQDARDGGSERYCVLQNRSSDMWIDFTVATTWSVDRKFADEMDALEPGFYYLFFAQCTKNLQISFHMDAEFRNGVLNYLSAGDSPLPGVYLLMSLAFFSAAIMWLRYLRANASHIHNVHHMMTALVVCKTVSLFAESMRFYYMKTHGDTLTGWNEVYYVFMFLKGMMLFAVILLIGTGWSLLKPHLSTRDKYVITAVLVLQVLSNTAMIAVEETSVGTQSWVTWRDMLHLVDILCCFAILFPIVWSIRSLRASAFTDGKAHINLQKLTQFRSFYLIVVTYIYFTRIALFLLTASLPYNATWVAVFMGELASAAFFSVTGYRFRPVVQNPYLEVATHIEALDEFSLDDDDDMELQQIPIQRRDHLKYTAVKTNANGIKTAVTC